MEKARVHMEEMRWPATAVVDDDDAVRPAKRRREVGCDMESQKRQDRKEKV